MLDDNRRKPVTLGEEILDVSGRCESSIIRSAYSYLPPWRSGYPDKAVSRMGGVVYMTGSAG
jgi:hypothetical protein